MTRLLSLPLLLVLVTLGISQEVRKPAASNSMDAALQSMVDTERAFAKMSEEQGTRPSFMAFIADDGILFRPTAVKGKQWMIDHPAPVSEKRPLLSWYPAVAGIARAGDMGYTTGPWEFKNDIHDAKPVAFGNFLTVWKRQPDGSWKFAIDLGISNPQPDKPAPQWQLRKNSTLRAGGRSGHAKDEREALCARDREFSSVSSDRGAPTAFASFAADNVTMLREGKSPLVGRLVAAGALPESSTTWTWEPAFVDVSRSADLGYTYGTYLIASKDAPAKTLETGNYYRIWKKENGRWQVLFDLTNPIPPQTKND